MMNMKGKIVASLLFRRSIGGCRHDVIRWLSNSAAIDANAVVVTIDRLFFVVSSCCWSERHIDDLVIGLESNRSRIVMILAFPGLESKCSNCRPRLLSELLRSPAVLYKNMTRRTWRKKTSTSVGFPTTQSPIKTKIRCLASRESLFAIIPETSGSQ